MRRNLALGSAIALAVMIHGSTAHAGGPMVRISAPAHVGGPYQLETSNCNQPTELNVRAVADGRVNGKHTTIELRILPGDSPTRKLLARQWPAGKWIVRLVPMTQRGATTVVAIKPDGTLGESKYVWNKDGRREAERMLASR